MSVVRGILIQSGLLLALVTFTSCQGKSCWQAREDRNRFVNQTGTAQSFSIMSYSHGATVTQTVSLPATTTQQDILISSYTTEEGPYHHGKIDFFPEDGQCSGVQKMYYSSTQVTDPTAVTIKLCFGNLDTDNYDTKIYVVAKASACPGTTGELIRW